MRKTTEEIQGQLALEIAAANVELSELKGLLSFAKRKNEQLFRENTEICAKLSSYRKQAELAQSLQEKIGDYIAMLVKKAVDEIKDPQEWDSVEILEEKRNKAMELWKTFGGDGTALLKICKSLLGDKPLYKLFPEEDCLGTFEKDMSDFEDIGWREKYRFGKIVDSHFVVPGCYEFCDYEIDVKSPGYLSYQTKLYKGAVMLIAKNNPIGMFLASPGFFLKDFS